MMKSGRPKRRDDDNHPVVYEVKDCTVSVDTPIGNLMFIDEEKLKYDAIVHCRSLGRTLPTLKSLDMIDMIGRNLTDCHHPSNKRKTVFRHHRYWHVGLRLFPVKGMWSDGTVFDYLNDAKVFLNNVPDVNEYCQDAYLVPYWRALVPDSCDLKTKFFCLSPKSTGSFYFNTQHFVSFVLMPVIIILLLLFAFYVYVVDRRNRPRDHNSSISNISKEKTENLKFIVSAQNTSDFSYCTESVIVENLKQEKSKSKRKGKKESDKGLEKKSTAATADKSQKKRKKKKERENLPTEDDRVV